MNLYCPSCATVHAIHPDQVERIVYTLVAAYADAITEPDDGDRVAAGDDPVLRQACLWEVGRWGRDGELYAEHVEQCLGSRRAAAPPPVDPAHLSLPGGVLTTGQLRDRGTLAAHTADTTEAP